MGVTRETLHSVDEGLVVGCEIAARGDKARWVEARGREARK